MMRTLNSQGSHSVESIHLSSPCRQCFGLPLLLNGEGLKMLVELNVDSEELNVPDDFRQNTQKKTDTREEEESLFV
ncbi:hypothetical protein UY3_13761 [Chelonia mydas]|uniref:Uncharacterized protein n=1 Tax=Chelonia mydas TaxID=8469 RepID=M7AUQ7_CHEMY|nr:hypothetical protein UY3_13761 [Chelonia mydas]